MSPEKANLILVIFCVMLLVPIAMIVLFVVFNHRKNKLLEHQQAQRKKFEHQLAESQIEIREETLRNISWELHDNVGQLLTLAKFHLQNSRNNQEKITETVEVLGKALQELRSLSKSINPDTIESMTLLEAINNEMERFERMKFLKTDFQILGPVFQLPKKEEIIVFRILQEFFSNTIKHSRATSLKVKAIFQDKTIEITCKDDGVGFNPQHKHSGIGLSNMKTRAELVNYKLEIISKTEEGTKISLTKTY